MTRRNAHVFPNPIPPPDMYELPSHPGPHQNAPRLPWAPLSSYWKQHLPTIQRANRLVASVPLQALEWESWPTRSTIFWIPKRCSGWFFGEIPWCIWRPHGFVFFFSVRFLGEVWRLVLAYWKMGCMEKNLIDFIFWGGYRSTKNRNQTKFFPIIRTLPQTQ